MAACNYFYYCNIIFINETERFRISVLIPHSHQSLNMFKCCLVKHGLKGHCHGDFNAFREKVLKLVNRSSRTRNAPSTSRWK